MKVLWISHLLPYPPKGGVMQRSFNLIREAGRNNDIYLYAFNQKAWLPEKGQIIDAKKHLEKYCKEVKIFEIPCDNSNPMWYLLVLYSFFAPNPYTVNWTTSRKMRSSIQNFLKRNRVDIIHCDTIGLAENIKGIGKIPMVLNHHNIESHMMIRRANKERNLSAKLYFLVEGHKLRKYEKKFCRLFNVNIAVSVLDRKRLLAMDPGLHVEDVPNGVDIDYFKGTKHNIVKHNLVFAGSMDWYPNEDAMIYFLRSIWPSIKKKYPDASLTIAGRRPSAKLKSMVSGYSSVNLTGYVHDVRPLIDRAEVYVCPIRDGGGTKLKVLDAMAMQKAIVSTTIGAEGLEIQDGGQVLIADDPKTFLEKIGLLFEDLEQREYLANNARNFVEKYYAWQVVGKKLTAAYGAAAQNSGAWPR